MTAPTFEAALSRHLNAIETRDPSLFRESAGPGPTLFTIVQNGHAFTTRDELIALHDEWFKRDDWLWEGEVVRRIVGADLGVAVIRYEYRDNPAAAPMRSWLTLVFQQEEGDWRLVHDHNTMINEVAN